MNSSKDTILKHYDIGNFRLIKVAKFGQIIWCFCWNKSWHLKVQYQPWIEANNEQSKYLDQLLKKRKHGKQSTS